MLTCILEVIDLLMNDPNATLDTQTEPFAQRQFQTHPEFKPNGTPFCYWHTARWHLAKANLSLPVGLPGSVNLGPDAQQYNLPTDFTFTRYHTHSLIKNGQLITAELQVGNLSEDTHMELFTAGLTQDSYEPNGRYLLNLNSLPLLNAKLESLANNLKAYDIAQVVLLDAFESLQLKVYKEYESKYIATKQPYDEKQKAFLLLKNLTPSGFISTVKTENHSLAQTLEFVVHGLHPPKVTEVINRMVEWRNLNAAHQHMAFYIAELDSLKIHFDNLSVFRDYLDTQINQLITRRTRRRQFLNKVRFSILVGASWFPDLDPNDPIIHLSHKIEFKLGHRKCH